MDISKEITRIINIANTHLTEMNLFANNPNIGRLGYGGMKEVIEELKNLVEKLEMKEVIKELKNLVEKLEKKS